MKIEKTKNGCYTLSVKIGDKCYSKTYAGYTLQEAKRLFMKYIMELL